MPSTDPAATPGRIRVVVVDDDRFVRLGIGEILRGAGDIEVVGDAEDGDEAVEVARALRPDVVLIDIHMRRVDGLEATRRLRASDNPPGVVIMTALDVDDQVARAIEAGAHSFLSKDEPPHTFHQSIRAVATGNALFGVESIRELVRSGAARTAGHGNDLAVLTDREREVLAAAATGASNAEIARALHLGETTVKTHLSAVMTKLGVPNRVGAALVAFRAGLVS